MAAKKHLSVCGSITKKESLILITSNILKNSMVAEADQPYSGYYGGIPDKARPNSLFLFTDRYYTLEESLRMTQHIKLCAKNKVNVASAVIQSRNHCLPAIRIRNFPDYQHLEMLQHCYAELGVKFQRKTQVDPEALVSVNKCFFLETAGPGVYLDRTEAHEGYIAVSQYMNWQDFEELIRQVRNNSDCPLFDAAPGGLIMEGRVTDILRIYSHHLDVQLLQVIRKEVDKWI